MKIQAVLLFVLTNPVNYGIMWMYFFISKNKGEKVMDQKKEFPPTQIENVKSQKEEKVTDKKQEYIPPKLEIIKFEVGDIITTSGWDDDDELPDDDTED